MRFNEDLASIHGYLCADGYVIKNPASQKHKYYRIGLRNTSIKLLNDFKEKIDGVFGVNSRIFRNERCYIGSKHIYLFLTDKFCYYSDRWKLPPLSNRLLPFWLRAYFDCDGWVFIDRKTSRHIGLDSINKEGIMQIREALKRLGINSKVKTVKKGKMFRLLIYGRDNLSKFQQKIGFLHPVKTLKLQTALNTYKEYTWPLGVDLLLFLKPKIHGKRIRIHSIIRDNLNRLNIILKENHGIESKIYGPKISNYGSKYFELVIHKKDDLEKLRKFLIQ